jgi:predicted hydrocarbon binding protein
MKGIFFVQLQNYVCQKFDRSVWLQIMSQVGINEKQIYFSHQQYPEEDFFKLFFEAIRITKTSRDLLLTDMGENIAPFFFQTFGSVINKDWKTLDLVERMEYFNYKILQEGDDSTNMGKLTCKRVEPNKVEIKYSSPRKMCGVVTGLIKGFAKHFNEKVIIKQTKCIFEHDPECFFQVTLSDQLLSQKNHLLISK